MRVYVGIDIGGSHFGAGVITDQDVLLASSSTEWNNLELTPEAAVKSIAKAIQQLMAKASNTVASSSSSPLSIVGIGIGCPGQARDNVLVAASNLPKFKDAPLAAMLSKEMGHIPALLINDADAAICAEVFGHPEAYGGMKSVVMVTLGTGVGYGVVLNQQLYQGSHGLLEGGHMVVCTGPASRRCGCGQVGCVEAFSSASSTARRLMEYDHSDKPSSSSSSSSSIVAPVLTGKDVFARYSVNDFNAVRVVEETAEHLATLVLHISRALDPDAIVFGGGLAQAGETLLGLVRKYVAQKTWTVLPSPVQVLLGKGIEEAGVRGAAYAARQRFMPSQSNANQHKPVTIQGQIGQRWLGLLGGAVAGSSLALLFLCRSPRGQGTQYIVQALLLGQIGIGTAMLLEYHSHSLR